MGEGCRVCRPEKIGGLGVDHRAYRSPQCLSHRTDCLCAEGTGDLESGERCEIKDRGQLGNGAWASAGAHCQRMATMFQKAFRGTMSLSLMKNWAEHFSEPQITGSRPAICFLVISPKVPHEGQDSTAQYGSSCSPTWPAFSNTKIVPGSMYSGIHSLKTRSSPTMSPPPSTQSRSMKPLFYAVRMTRNRCTSWRCECRTESGEPYHLSK